MKGKRKKGEEEDHLVLKKKKKVSKVATDSDRGTLSVGLITEMPLKTELWKLKIPKMCFQFL